MAIAVYKPGQGYWVRVLSAAFLGVLVFAAAGWLFEQGKPIAAMLPADSWRIVPEASQPEFVGIEGTSVELYATSGRTPKPEDLIGTAVVRQASADQLVLEPFEVNTNAQGEPFEVEQAQLVSFTTVPQERRMVVPITLPNKTPVVQETYIQGGMAGLTILLGAVGIYWYTALNRKTVDFLCNTDSEMKKVNWSTPRDIKLSTIVVIVATFLIALVLFAFDYSFAWFFTQIGLRHTS